MMDKCIHADIILKIFKTCRLIKKNVNILANAHTGNEPHEFLIKVMKEYDALIQSVINLRHECGSIDPAIAASAPIALTALPKPSQTSLV